MGDTFSFDAEGLMQLADRHAAGFAAASPFPSVVLDDFLPAAAATRLADVFPPPDDPIFLAKDSDHQVLKRGIGDASRLRHADPFILSVLWAFNSHPFCVFLERLTGIAGIIPDPHYQGGGLHQILRGGSLKVHADFNYLPRLNLHRKLNVLLYLNRDWQDDWGGHLELWDQEMTRCVRSIAPIINRCVIFRTSRFSYHGHPDPLAVPDGVTRKSLAFYYYTSAPDEDDRAQHSTLWQQRPGTADPPGKKR